MIDKTIPLHLGAAVPPVVIDCTEGDTMWRWHFPLFANGARWQIPNNSMATFAGVKLDGNVFDLAATVSDNEVVVDATEQITACPGDVLCVVRVFDSYGKVVASCRVILRCKQSPQSMGIVSESVISAYNDAIERLGEAIGVQQNVTDWLEANITEPEGVVIDKSLSVSGAAADAAAVGDLKSALDKVTPVLPYYPTFVRGSGNINDGYFAPSDSVLIRIIEMEYISTAVFNELYIKAGLAWIVCYYDENKDFISSTGGWNSKALYDLDETKPYARLLLKNTDDSNFTAVPVDAAYLVNKNAKYLAEKQFNDVNNAIFGLAYSESGSSANAANTARWFIPMEFSHGWLHEILVKDSNSAGTVTVEIWERCGNTFTRTEEIPIGVGVGDNVLSIKRAIADRTYISFILSVNGNVVVNDSGDNPAWLLRDKTLTSFSLSALETTGFTLSADVMWYGINTADGGNEHVYHIGENDNVAEIITKAMKYVGSIVYIEPYEHDCIAEWEVFFGEGYFANMSTGRGIELQNDIHIIGCSGHKLKCYYTGDNDYVMENFSLFNNPSGGSGYTLENVCIDTKKIRYCIHDERGSDATPYKVKYLRCIMSQDMTGSTWDHSRACIGGGLGQHGDVLVEDCIFSTVTSQANMDSLAYHNSAGKNAQSSVVIANCYCTGDSTLQLASYGPSTLKTKVLVANCSFGSDIEVLDWTSGTPNLEIYQINNEVRNA